MYRFVSNNLVKPKRQRRGFAILTVHGAVFDTLTACGAAFHPQRQRRGM